MAPTGYILVGVRVGVSGGWGLRWIFALTDCILVLEITAFAFNFFLSVPLFKLGSFLMLKGEESH